LSKADNIAKQNSNQSRFRAQSRPNLQPLRLHHRRRQNRRSTDSLNNVQLLHSLVLFEGEQIPLHFNSRSLTWTNKHQHPFYSFNSSIFVGFCCPTKLLEFPAIPHLSNHRIKSNPRSKASSNPLQLGGVFFHGRRWPSPVAGDQNNKQISKWPTQKRKSDCRPATRATFF